MTFSKAAFIVGEVIFLFVAQAVGGPPWTLVATTAFVAMACSAPRAVAIAWAAPGLLWLMCFRLTGDRELFFPYAMHLAAVAICAAGDRGTWWAATGGAAVALAFLGIRIAQQATGRVLAVEIVVATAIVAVAVWLRTRCPRHPAVDAAIVGCSSLLAYASLAL